MKIIVEVEFDIKVHDSKITPENYIVDSLTYLLDKARIGKYKIVEIREGVECKCEFHSEVQ